MFHKSIQYALEKLGKSKSGFETTVVSKFKRKRRVGSGNELVDYSRLRVLVLTKRHVGSGNEIGKTANVKFSYRLQYHGPETLLLAQLLSRFCEFRPSEEPQ